MNKNKLIQKTNVFEYTIIGSHVSNYNDYNIIIEPGDIDINILGIHFSVNQNLCNLTLNEDIEYKATPNYKNKPIAHNRYYFGNSKLIIGNVSEKLTNSGKILFNRSTNSEWKTENYELQGWTLNKYKKYAFVINTEGTKQAIFNFSCFWTETGSQQEDNANLLPLHPSFPVNNQ